MRPDNKAKHPELTRSGACGAKYTFLPKTLTFLPVFFGPRGHRQLRPGRGGGEAGVFYSLLLLSSSMYLILLSYPLSLVRFHFLICLGTALTIDFPNPSTETLM